MSTSTSTSQRPSPHLSPSLRSPRRLCVAMAAAATAAAAVALMAPPARACSPENPPPPHYCTPAGSTLYNGVSSASIPPDAAISFTGRDLPGVELVTASGEPVPFDWSPEGGVALLIPRSPLAPESRYELRYQETCVDPEQEQQGPPEARSIAFETTPAVSFPTRLGTLTVTRERKSVPVSVCLPGEADVAVAHIKLQPSAELVPYLPLTFASGTINGQPSYVFLPPGSRMDDAGEVYVAGVTVDCEGTGNGFTPRRFTIALAPRVLAGEGGQSTLPPEQIEFDLNCEPGLGAEVGPPAEPDGGPAGTPEGPDSDSSTPGGCAVAGAPGASALPAWLALALAGMVLRLRAHRRR